jgi:hypothetical protein
VHRIDLPGLFVEDLLLSDMIFRQLSGTLRDAGVTPLMQRRSSLWVVGGRERLRDIVGGTSASPAQLFDSAFDERIYESILAELPRRGSMQTDSMKFLLVSESTACKRALSLLTGDEVRKVLDRQNLPHVAESAPVMFAGPRSPRRRGLKADLSPGSRFDGLYRLL